MHKAAAIVRNVLEDAGKEMAEEIREDISVPGNARVRSKPGEPPRRQTGNLRSRVQYKVAEGEAAADVYVLTVMDDAAYAGFLEHGTSRMAPRPFFSPIESKWAPLMAQRFDFTFRLGGGSAA